MINFFGAGGGGAASCAVFGGGAILSFEACCDWLSAEFAWLAEKSSLDFWLAAESRRDLLNFDAFAGLLVLAAGALTGGVLAAGEFVEGGVISVTALGLPTLLTSRLLTTVLTPATLAA